MSAFSEYLSECVSQHLTTLECSKNELIELCEVNRSTFFQCLRGVRLPTGALFRTLLEQLAISPAEREELQQRYYAELIGVECFRRRRSVESCLETLAAVFSTTETPPSKELPELATYQGKILGREEIFRTLEDLARRELSQEEPCMDLFLPPQCKPFFDELKEIYCGCGGKTVRLRQLVQFSEEKEAKELESLSLLRLLSRFLLSGCEGYEARYYYADRCYPEMIAIVYPYFVITSERLLLLNKEVDAALMVMDPEMRTVCRMQFQDSLKRGRSFCCATSAQELTEKALCRWRGKKLEVYSLSKMPIFGAFLPGVLMSRVIKAYCPREQRSAVMNIYRNLKRNGKFTGFCTRQGILHFAQTGILAGIEQFARVEWEDRKEMLEALLRCVSRKGRLFLFDERRIPVPPLHSVTVFDGKCLLLCSCAGQEMKSYQFLEQNLTDSFVDYFRGLSDDPSVLGREQLKQVLREAIALCEGKTEENAPEG